MIQKKFIFLLLLLLSSCGYEAIHSKKNIINYNFYISDLNFTGDREINLKIKEKLNNYTTNQKGKNFKLRITSNSEKIVLVKDATGDATSFQQKIVINVEVLLDNKFKNNFMIKEIFNYKSDTNKFDLRRYEKQIKNNLAQTATDKLIVRLSNIQ